MPAKATTHHQLGFQTHDTVRPPSSIIEMPRTPTILEKDEGWREPLRRRNRPPPANQSSNTSLSQRRTPLAPPISPRMALQAFFLMSHTETFAVSE